MMDPTPSPPTGTAPRTLVLICEDWPVRAAGRADVDRPAAVFSHRGIVSANPAARAAGVRVGLGRREAQGRCPELELIAHDPARDARCFEPVVASMTTFTPRVEIIEPGVAALGTRGPARYFGGEAALAGRMLDAAHIPGGEPVIRRSRIRVGVADGPLLARLAALGAAAGSARVIAPEDTPGFVAGLTLATVAPFVPDRGVLEVWRQLGLRTLGEVAALPVDAVLGRFGSEGVWVHRLATGVDPTLISPTPLPDDVDEVVDFDPPEIRAEAVAFATRAAAATFVGRLADLGLSCAQVLITLWTDHAEEHRRRWRLDGPGRAGEHLDALIAERVRWQTDGWLSGPASTRPTAGITRVVLAPGQIRPARGRQLGFWGGASAADQRAMRAVARLEALAGPDAVRKVEMRGGRQPIEEAVLVPTAIAGLPRHRSVTGGGDPAPWPGRLPRPSPFTVSAEPRRIQVLDITGSDLEVTGRGEVRTRPATVRFTDRDDRASAIVAWAGPWPVDERWWDRSRRRRQARLQLVTDQGTALLVVRRDRQWWLDAVYT